METQQTINEWCNQRFGEPTGPVPPMLRAIDEMVEACMAVGMDLDTIVNRVKQEYSVQSQKATPPNISELASEIAGIIIVLNRVAHSVGIDIQQAVEDEMAKNRKRNNHKGDK